MKKLLSLTLLAMMLSVSSFALYPIFTHSGVCVGSTRTLYDSTTGGTWSSSNTSVASIDPLTGVVTGIAAGTATITYTLGSYVTSPITVSPVPAPISGTSPICVGGTTTYTDATTGGIWSTSSSYVATVGTTTGVVTGVHAGVTTISYSITTGCGVAASVTVIPLPVVSISGSSTVCIGDTITLNDSAGYTGTWSSSNTAIASVSGGVVTGVASGTATISFTTTGICGTTTGTKIITVTSTTSPGSITGTSTLGIGYTATLHNTVSGGTWSSSNTAIASVDATTGVWTAVASGTATITYTVIGCSGPAYTTYAVTVSPFDGISGHILFTGTPYYGGVKVYLITYNPGTLDLEAYDSTVVYSSGSSAFYQFSGVRTDSFRIKAAQDSTSGSIGYMPTYHTSSFYWYSAAVLPHVSGTADINQDITMLYGTIPAGPGFIGGNVGTGANKGTSGGAAGLRMFAIDGSGNIATTTTDTHGDYAFSGLATGATYQIFPEALNYLTTPLTGITLTSASPSMTVAGFIQHTISLTITPAIALGTGNTAASISSVSVFPNPSAGTICLQWNALSAEKGKVSITDVAGRIVYSDNITLTQGMGVKQIDLSDVTNGTYLINVSAGSVNYSSKVQIAH